LNRKESEKDIEITDIQILLKLRNTTFGRRAGSYLLSKGTASCLDSCSLKERR
jgi:hypothetical protein